MGSVRKNPKNGEKKTNHLETMTKHAPQDRYSIETPKGTNQYALA
jgi:hypothetical protein